VLAAVAALAACGGSNGSSGTSAQSLDDVLAAVDGLSGKARTDKLVELAQEEGGVDVYTSSSIDYMTELAGAFEDAYDLDVSLYKTSSEALVQRMIEEKKAGFHGSDVAETNTPGLIALDDEGIITPYASPSVDKLVDGSVGKSWIDDKSNTFVVAWNTKRVPKGDEPTSLEDLTDPRWKGRVVLEADDSDWYKTLWDDLVASGKTPAEADKIFEGIAANAAFVNGHSLMADLVAAGEFDVTLDSYLHTVRGLQQKGAPLAWQPAVEPVVTRPDGIAVVADAKHPAAALLFSDFTLDQGQQVFADFFLTPARKDLSVPESIGHVAMDVPDYVANQDEWTKRYEQLVRLGKAGPEG
jgi:iron(III) transport system substrate-binding protein